MEIYVRNNDPYLNRSPANHNPFLAPYGFMFSDWPSHTENINTKLSLIGPLEINWTNQFIKLCNHENAFEILSTKVAVKFRIVDNLTTCVNIPILTNWGRVTHICVSKLSIIGDNGMSPDPPSHYLNQCWNIVKCNLKSTVQKLIEIHTFSFKNIHLKISSGKWRPFWLGLNVLTEILGCNYVYMHKCYIISVG